MGGDSNDSTSDSDYMDVFQVCDKHVGHKDVAYTQQIQGERTLAKRSDVPRSRDGESSELKGRNGETPAAPETEFCVPMEVERNWVTDDLDVTEVEMIGGRSKGKMKANDHVAESTAHIAKSSSAVEDGRTGLLEDFHKLSFAEPLPNPPDIPTLAPNITAVPFPTSRATRTDVSQTAYSPIFHAFFHLFCCRRIGRYQPQVRQLLICSLHRRC